MSSSWRNRSVGSELTLGLIPCRTSPRSSACLRMVATADTGQRVTRPPAQPGTGKKARKARARLEALQAEAAAEAGHSRSRHLRGT